MVTKAPQLFKWKRFQSEIILWVVRRICQFAIRYRDLVLMADERGFKITCTIMMRWMHQYATKLEKLVKPKLKTTCSPQRLNETYLEINGHVNIHT